MDDAGREGLGSEAEELVLRTIAAHADSLLRTARRHSLCADDAQDAYQRSLEIFMRHAARLDRGRAGAWLHTVVKHEAMAIRRSRRQLVGVQDTELEAQGTGAAPSPEDQLLAFDMVGRSAEALKRLKPQELRALWLKAQGYSYSDIGEITGWTYTKVNRCLTEGRASFLERYAGIESGAECRRWAPVLSAMVDGEATPEQVLEARPHLRNCPGCRATLKALRESSAPLAAVLPVPLVVTAVSDGGEAVSGVLVRVYEAIAGGVHERAVASATKVQAVLEASAASKVAAVAASAAAVAGGGYATVDRVADQRDSRPPERVVSQTPAPAPPAPVSPGPAPATPAAADPDAAAASPTPAPDPEPQREFDDPAPAAAAREFKPAEFESGGSGAEASASAPAATEPTAAAPAAARPPPAEFAGTGASASRGGEFGP